MPKPTRRGYQEKDEIQFGDAGAKLLKQAAVEMQFLLDHGYRPKPVSTFIGNHYMFSERQRIALTRMVSASIDIISREDRRLDLSLLKGKDIVIDGFNTIITLEVAYSGSLVLECMDGCIRDLAGLRGTYHIIEATTSCILLIYKTLTQVGVNSITWYLDAPVSNSGRLRQLIKELAKDGQILTHVEVINEVDQTLEQSEYVITSDAIILDKCISWVNLNQAILAKLPNVWTLKL